MDIKEKIYTSICVLFTILIVVGNLIYQKFVSLNIFNFISFELSVGAITYPLTFLLTDLITEFYGKERANFCVKLGIIINIFIALMIAFLDHLDATSWSKINNDTFHKVFGMYSVGFIGSIIACYTSQFIDIIIYLWIRKITKGRFLWIRNNFSTAISLFIDTTIVISFMTFYGALDKDHMFNLIINSYSFKLFFTILSTPLFYLAVTTISYIINNSNKK